jgi:hypothetical protein
LDGEAKTVPLNGLERGGWEDHLDSVGSIIDFGIGCWNLRSKDEKNVRCQEMNVRVAESSKLCEN